MNIVLRIALLAALVIYFGCIIHLLKKKRLNLKYTLLWIFSGVIMVLIVIFPQILEAVIHILGIVEFTNGVFALMIFFLIIIAMSISSAVSKLNDQIRQLVQKCSMYEERIRILEDKLTEKNQK